MNDKKNIYDSSSISVLENIDAIRKYPGMYIGSIHNPNHLFNEVVDNSVDECLMGFCNELYITVLSPTSIKIRDIGRGIPHGLHEGSQVRACELVFLKIHAGGKFDTNTYQKSGGLHGVGLTAVNALSSTLIVKSHRDNQTCVMLFKKGILLSTTLEEQTEPSGTEIVMDADESIFDNNYFDIEELYQRIKYISALNPKLTIYFKNNLIEDSIEEKINTDKGIETLVIDKCKDPLLKRNIAIIEKEGIIEIDAFINWDKNKKDEDFMAFTNCIIQPDYGTHVSGIRNGIIKFLLEIKEINEISDNFTWTEIKKGTICAISVRLQSPKFDSQSKNRLVSSEVRRKVEELTYKILKEQYKNNSLLLQPIIDQIRSILIAKSVKSKKEDISLSAFMYEGRLIDCRETDPAKREIFIVEGESAGGSIKQCRDKQTQAILTLRGKILNVEKANIKQIIHSETLSIIASSLGGQYLNNGTVLVDKIKYGRVIILVDADVDGSHIRSLLLTLFYRHMPEIIYNNNIFVATPPLYRLQGKDKSIYFNKNEELAAFLVNTMISSHIKELQCEEKEKGIVSQLIEIFNENVDVKNDIFLTGILDLLIDLKINTFEKLVDKTNELVEHIKNKMSNMECYLGNNNQIILEEFATMKKLTLTEEIFQNKSFKIFKKFFSKSNDKVFSNLDKKSRNVYNNGIIKQIQICFCKMEDDLIIQRFKGLGEMNPDQLFETTMDPLKRRLKQITIQDAIKANNLCNILMGDDPSKRKKFILDNYNTENL